MAEVRTAAPFVRSGMTAKGDLREFFDNSPSSILQLAP
jgi:hypothetical protein